MIESFSFNYSDTCNHFFSIYSIIRRASSSFDSIISDLSSPLGFCRIYDFSLSIRVWSLLLFFLSSIFYYLKLYI